MSNGCFSPVYKFMNDKEIKDVIFKYRFKKDLFFPIPIHFNISKRNKKLIYKSRSFKLSYNSKIIGKFNIESIFKLEKKKLLKKYFGTTSMKHIGVRNFINLDEYFVSGKVKLFKNFRTDDNFSPKFWKKKFKLLRLKKIVGFHTRNIPHATHEELHKIALKSCDSLFIHPITGNLKKGDFKRSVILKAYRIYLKTIKFKNVYFSELLTFARFAGPREAAFHALIRKNFGCTHFIIGRDHAGIKNFYKKYESQSFCKKNQKKIGIKILAIQEPYYCKKCKIMRSPINNCNHSSKFRKFLSGTEIRNFIKKKRNIPNYYLNKNIAKHLSTSSFR